MRSAIHRPLLALGLAAVLAACSGADTGPGVATLEDPGASASPVASTAPTDPQEAFLAFAQCMRDNGIDMPDPEIVDDAGGGNVGMAFKVGGDAGSVDKEEFRAADAACKHFLANVISDKTTGGISPEDEDKLLEFTHCMREHGIDMPDPQTSGVIVDEEQGTGSNLDPNDPDFQAAQEACAGLLPGKIQGGAAPGPVMGPNGGGGVEPAKPIK